MKNVNYDKNKQSVRRWLFEIIDKNLTGRVRVNALTFPSKQGIQGIDSKVKSFEGLLRKRFKRLRLTGLECNSKLYRKLKNQCPDWLKLVNEYDHTHFKGEAFFLNRYNVLWLDYFGGTNRQNLKTLTNAFKNDWIDDNSVLAVTLSRTPRTIHTATRRLLQRYSKDGSLENGHFNWLKKRAAKYGYRIELIDIKQYKNNDVSINAVPMTTIAYRVSRIQ